MDEGFDQSSAPALNYASQLVNSQSIGETISRATSPGLPSSASPGDAKRYRPRTFAYFDLLPYKVEEEAERDTALHGILKHLYIAVKAEDFSSGVVHWTRQLQAWLSLKFDMSHELRAKLAKLYFHLALAPGLDNSEADRFSRMVVTLTRFVAYTQ
jgi:proteasome activator subunit 4